MNTERVNSVITLAMQTEWLLERIDEEKKDDSVLLSKVLNDFQRIKLLDTENVKDRPFMNQFVFIPSLFACIVLPKEEYYTSIPQKPINELCAGWGLNFDNAKKSDDLQSFIRHLRNSICHGNMDYDDYHKFIFKDNEYTIVIPTENLRMFTRAFCWYVLTKDIELKGLFKI